MGDEAEGGRTHETMRQPAGRGTAQSRVEISEIKLSRAVSMPNVPRA